MKHRKLRIPWSVTWGLLCVLLIALWVRSYHTQSTISIRDRASGYWTFLGSNSGTMYFHRSAVETFRSPGSRPTPRWYYHVGDASKPQAVFVWNSNVSRWPVGISFPYWLPVILAAVAATVPWLSWSKRFSLRTLLMATTLFAVVLGLVVYAASN
jgi:hypothetical protein